MTGIREVKLEVKLLNDSGSQGFKGRIIRHLKAFIRQSIGIV